MRATVSGGDENICSSLSQRLVKFVWFPSDPFQVHEPKATFMTSLAVSYIYFNHVYMVAKYIASWILKQSSVKYVATGCNINPASILSGFLVIQ